MKKIRRFAAMVAAMALAAVMVAPSAMMSASAEAAEKTISFTGATEKGTHKYTAYRIFDGTANENGMNLAEKASLGNATWAGTEGKLADFIEALQNNTTLANDFDEATTVADIINILKDYEANSAKAKAFAAVAVENAAALGLPSVSSGEGSATTLNVETDGYYVISETFTPDTTNGGTEGAQTAYLLGVYDAAVGAEVTVKSSVPSVEKKVQDINDSADTPALTGLQDSADYDIGDIISYTITATIGAGIDSFDAYSLQFVDDMSKGLAMVNLDNSDTANKWKVEVIHGTDSPVDVTEMFDAKEKEGSAFTDGKVYTWSVTDIKTYGEEGEEKTLAAGDTVVLTYYAQLDSDAVVGAAGNPNTVSLKYDNNPNKSGEGTPGGETPKDKNIVFTYETVFNKVDENGNALDGADFELYKKTGTNTWTKVTELNGTDSDAINPTKTKSVDGTTFTFSGLDDGVYKLEETTTPDGYNTIDPIEFTITADHEVMANDPKLIKLTGTDGAEFKMTSVREQGQLSADIVNEKGATLPSTGGIGTKLFVVGGGLAAAMAGVYLVSKKKAKDETAE